MPTVTYESIGEVVVFDGSNADELAELVGTDSAPEPDESGAITLEVPQPPPSGSVELALNPGDGLAPRMGGFLYYSTEVLESYEVAS